MAPPAAGRGIVLLVVLYLASLAAAKGLGAPRLAGSVAVARTKASASGRGRDPAPQQTVVNPIIAGKPCVYTPAILPEFVDIETFTSSKPLTSCNDARLSAKQAAACLTCASIRNRRKCLAQTAATYHGVDKESCTWVGTSPRTGHAAQEKQVVLSLGINSPNDRMLRLATDVCAVEVSFSLENAGGRRVFPVAMMESWLYGVVNGEELPWGQQSGGICLVKQKRWGCSTTVVRHKAATALTLSSTIWTNSQAIVAALQRSNDTCADTPDGACTAFGPPYNYDVLITLKEHRCRQGSQPGNWAPSKVALPFGQSGIAISPGGRKTEDMRDYWFSLDGASRASWKITSQYPIVVAAVKLSDYDNLCKEGTDAAGRKVAKCDWTQLKAVARPGTYCLGTYCAGSVKQDPKARDQVLVQAYPKFTYFVDAPWIMNATETPAQIVELKELNLWL